ncbi:TPA: hypothetical protein ACX6RX_003215 [Photobacterium damselae]
MSSIFSAGGMLSKPAFSRLKQSIKSDANNKPTIDEVSEKLFFESIDDGMFLEAINRAHDTNMRTEAASAVITWVEEGDSEPDAFDSLAFGLAGGNDDEYDLDDDQVDDYNKYLQLMVDFCLQLGASENDCQGLIDGDDSASERVFNTIEEQREKGNPEERIAEFSVKEQLMLEATKKVIRDGKVVLIKTNKRKRRMSAAQKAALKKARLKAHSSSAKAARRKALRMRNSRNM